MTGVNVLSLFDGMSCGQIALERAGIKVDNYYASEIDKYAIKVTQKNYPSTIQIGNVLDVKSNQLPDIDLLIGGSPCQGLSISKTNKDGLLDERSSLFYEYIRLLHDVKPKYFLLENVPMDEESENIFTKLMKVKPIKICSSLFSAQKRNRLYWTNIPLEINDNINCSDVLKDILDREYDRKYILNERLQNRYRKISDIDSGKTIIGTTALPGKIGQRDRVYNINCKFPTLTATDYKQPKQLIDENGMLRRITPSECEKLQTVPVGYTNCVSDTQRYKMLGNGWTVDVIAYILKGVKENKN